MNFLQRLSMKGRAIISFSSHGCQGTIHEYEFSGIIIGTEDTDRTKFYKHEFMYLVEIQHSLCERKIPKTTVKIASWYCNNDEAIVIHID